MCRFPNYEVATFNTFEMMVASRLSHHL